MSSYRALPGNLIDIANTAQRYLVREFGVSQSKINIETGISDAIRFSPTINATTKHYDLICVEVVDESRLEEVMHANLLPFAIECRNLGLPVKLFIAIMRGLHASLSKSVLKNARDNGIAILELFPPNHGDIIGNMPVSLSLCGLRYFDLCEFSPKYREPLKLAIETFKGGNPAKGCSDVYDLLEDLTRRIGKKCDSIPNAFIKKSHSIDWDRGSWATILNFINSNLHRSAVNCPELTTQLFSRLIGITSYRNAVGHRIRSVKKRIERDKSLRTRFESAMDDLLQLIKASRPLRP